MDIKRKLELAEQHIRSITQHEDADSLLRGAALDRLTALIEKERVQMEARVIAKLGEALPEDTNGNGAEPAKPKH